MKKQEQSLIDEILNINKRIIFIHPYSGKSSKAISEGKVPAPNWVDNKWVELTNNLIEKYNCIIIFTGVGIERKWIENIISKINKKKNVINAAGKFSLEEIASLFKKADLLISVDTSIAHIGGMVGIPQIVLSYINPKIVGPFAKYPERSKILFHPEVCNSCMRYACPEKDNICMKVITTEEVFNLANKLLHIGI